MAPGRSAEFVAAAARDVAAARITQWKQRSFGNTPELADVLIGLIATGAKTGTFSLPVEFRERPEARPVAGDHFVVTRFDGTPALLYRVTEVETLPFSAIAARHVECEGPPLRNVEAWREFHWNYWTTLLARFGARPERSMPVIFQRFELLYPPLPSPAAGA